MKTIIIRNQESCARARIDASTVTFPLLPGQKVVSVFPETFRKLDKTVHSFEVETRAGVIKVNANNRAQAGVITRDAGYEVRSVNMVG